MVQIPKRMGAIMFVLVLLLGATSSFAADKTETYPLTSLERLKLSNVVAKPMAYKGRDAVQVKLAPGPYGGPDRNTFVYLPEVDFHNGVIEIDVVGALAPEAGQDARGFVGIAFRIAPDLSKCEGIYLRPTNGRANDQVRRNHSTQYFAFPDYTFARLRKESPERYESYVDLVPGEWTKMRIEVEGERARLYVHGAEQPVLLVNDLKLGKDARGSIGLWVDSGTEGYFSNLRVTYKD
jgi:hypothetical protein